MKTWTNWMECRRTSYRNVEYNFVSANSCFQLDHCWNACWAQRHARNWTNNDRPRFILNVYLLWRIISTYLFTKDKKKTMIVKYVKNITFLCCFSVSGNSGKALVIQNNLPTERLTFWWRQPFLRSLIK